MTKQNPTDTPQCPGPGAEIVDFKSARARQSKARPPEARASERPAPSSRSHQQVWHTLQNIGAVLLLLVLVAGGAWLIVQLRQSMRLEACIESGRRNCARIDLDTP